MLRSYEDITSAIAQPPKWYDENGVPRYCEFSINNLGVYIKYALYGVIACQNCGQEFNVGMGYDHYEICTHLQSQDELSNQACVFENKIEDLVNGFGYGDPPRHSSPSGLACAGQTMSSVEIAITQVWSRDSLSKWHRLHEYEGPLEIPSWFQQD